MIPSVDSIQAELAVAKERLKLVDTSIGRTKAVHTQRSAVFRDQRKNEMADRGPKNPEKREETSDRVVLERRNQLPRADLDASDLRQRLGRKRPPQAEQEVLEPVKRQRSFRDFDEPRNQDFRKDRNERPTADRFGAQKIRKESDIEMEPIRRPRIISHVVQPLDDRTRDEVVKLQGQDKVGKARNRRMFGALLGTLSKFQREETKHKDQEDRRAQAEKKIEEKEKKEKEMMKLRKQELIIEKKKQELQVIHLQMKAERVREFDEWVKNTELLKNFVGTKKKPVIYYKPKVINKKVQQKLDDSSAETEGRIMQRKQKLEDELLGMDEIFRIKCEDMSRPRTRSENAKMEVDAEVEQENGKPQKKTPKSEKGEDKAREAEEYEQPESPKLGESPRLYEHDEDMQETPDEPKGENAENSPKELVEEMPNQPESPEKEVNNKQDSEHGEDKKKGESDESGASSNEESPQRAAEESE